MGKFETRKLNFASCNQRHSRFEYHRSRTCVRIAPILGQWNRQNWTIRNFQVSHRG